ncbi:restriction endonuclease subunit S [Bariatricus massiliensis]|uniref:restriction endonuclease subunit S n=2 Tax=Bariatricus massiliensis TaxID=1745713 RepID=UPI0009EDC016|nr:restriction endonuclease subunit S [Bariatricus massiliensis]
MAEWKEYTVADVISTVIDYRGKTPKKLGGDWSDSGYRALSAKNIKTGKIVQPDSIRYVSEDMYRCWMKEEIQKEDILITSEAPFGQIYYWDSDEKIVLSQRLFAVRINQQFYPKYIYFYMTSSFFQTELDGRATGTTVVGLRQPELLKCKIFAPDYQEQKRIADTLWCLEQKINNNEAINNNLLEQVQTLYRNRFVDTVNNERRICRADEYFDISIGKTPPRKEPQWFSTNPQDVTWVSISDMGTCGLYIGSSSEQLTKEAVDRHNVKIVPDNTVLLSFKLTVGRIAITNGEMTTNEAIAHFKTDKKEINEYLYCYLKCFNYQTMGSTSSIATAVNSKIIKGMPFVVPTDDELMDFHSVAAPIFAKIKANQTESENLTAVRDTLLPKLMSGELDVSDIDP